MTQPERVLRGDLSKIFVPKILHFLSEAEKTGELTLSSGERQIQVQFQSGRLVFVSSGFMPGLGLNDFLVARGILTADVLTTANKEALREQKRLGVYLIEHNLISAQELFETINLQVKAKLFRSFGWTTGEYVFKDGVVSERPNHNLSINLPNIIYEGIRDYVSMDKLPPEFRGRKEDRLFRRPNPRLEMSEIKMKSRETRLIKMVDGKRSLRAIVQLGEAPKKESYKVLYALFVLGFIGFSEQVAATKAPKKPAAAAPKPPAEETKGYEISVADALIREAMQSVERIHEEVTKEGPAYRPGEEVSVDPVDLGTVDYQPPADEPLVEPMSLDAEDAGEPAADDDDRYVPEEDPSSQDTFQLYADDDGGPALEQVEPLEMGESLADAEPLALIDDDPPIDASATDSSPFELGGINPDVPVEVPATAKLDLMPVLDDSAADTTPTPDRVATIEVNAPIEDEAQQAAGDVDQLAVLDAEDKPPDADLPAEAVKRLDSVAEAHEREALPESADEITKRALFYVEQEAFGEAARMLEEGLGRYPENNAIKIQLAWAVYRDGDGDRAAYNRAESLLKGVLAEQPRSWMAFLTMGRVYKMEKQRDFAEMHLVRALELNPECTEARDEIRSLYK